MKKIVKTLVIIFFVSLFICPAKAAAPDEKKEVVILQSELPSQQSQSKYKLSKPKSTSSEEANNFAEEAEGAQDYTQIMNTVNSLVAPFVNFSNYEKR
ncbi:MAG TPA: hypothetical protein PLG15_02185 [Candidatus Gastranaerophilaceae bacterium]|nr:hypothetical protein [Candidatus Gastranaerophilaceae bacterium]HPT41171.1 hypothetical protein [Candidatus Gastranaerophilaceae bacterium]